jgi:glyoxylase-like metal-dependent hydrolase (beta-lactamase superfamily II)
MAHFRLSVELPLKRIVGYAARMPAFICNTCGTQYAPSDTPPGACLICTDERQYVPASGQSWTTLGRLRQSHANKFRQLAAGITLIETTPVFAIGQRAMLARTPAGNVLWDCIALIDDATVDLLNGLGGVAAIAISHPHYYTTMVEWSRALGGVPIYLHADDREWVMRTDPAVQFWDGDSKSIGEGLTLVRLGGHFEGGTILHWADWSEGRGVLLSGDILQVVPSGHVSFMWSYPNLIPLSAAKVKRMAELLEPFAFDAVYGAFSGRGQIDANGKKLVAHSVARYIARISES